MPSISRGRIEMSVQLRPTCARDQSGRMKMLAAPMLANSFSTLSFSPVSAAMTVVTDATPMTMPIVVSSARTLFAQICPSARNALCQVSVRRASGKRRRGIFRGFGVSRPTRGWRMEDRGWWSRQPSCRPHYPLFSILHPRIRLSRVRHRVLFGGQVGQDLAVLHPDDPPGVAGDVGLVGHHDDGLPGPVQ